MDTIRSKDNKLLKHLRKLKVKKCRQESKEFMIEGIRFIEEALMADVNIKYCLCSENISGDREKAIVKEMMDRDIKICMVEEKFIQDISDTKNPQGLFAVVEMGDSDRDKLLKEGDFVIIVDRIQDPGNLGTIIRTADAAKADAVYISDGTVDPYSPKVLRSTMGSIFHIPVITNTDIISAIDSLKEQGFTIYVSSLNASSAYYEEDYKNKTAIVIGNEANGVDSSIVKRADKLIKIDMPGKAESLNAAVAGGILLFEVVKQRMHVDK